MGKFKVGGKVIVYDGLERFTGKVTEIDASDNTLTIENNFTWFSFKQCRRLVKNKKEYCNCSESLFAYKTDAPGICHYCHKGFNPGRVVLAPKSEQDKSTEDLINRVIVLESQLKFVMDKLNFNPSEKIIESRQLHNSVLEQLKVFMEEHDRDIGKLSRRIDALTDDFELLRRGAERFEEEVKKNKEALISLDSRLRRTLFCSACGGWQTSGFEECRACTGTGAKL